MPGDLRTKSEAEPSSNGSCRSRPRTPARREKSVRKCNSPLSRRALSARGGHCSCRPWSSSKFLNKSSCDSSWTVKEHDISKDVWPVAQLRFSSRLEANTDPSEKTKRSHLRLDVFNFHAVTSSLSRPSRSRYSKWKELFWQELDIVLVGPGHRHFLQ